MKINKQSGLTVIELFIIIVIMIVISSIVFSSLSNFSDDQAIRNTASDITSILNKARQDTLSSLNSTNYGVHFETDKAVYFVGSLYSSSSSTNKITLFNQDVVIPSVGGLNIGGGSEVVFERLTGDTIGGTIKIQLLSDGSKQKIITISKTGSISSN